MFFKRRKIETVPVSEMTDYSERFAELERERTEGEYASCKQVIATTSIPAAANVGFMAYQHMKNKKDVVASKVTDEPINVVSTQSIPELSTLTETYTPLAVNTSTIPEPQNFIAEKSLEILATALDPVIQILVAISFPIASVIMVGACFFFMLGNSERAWNMIMNAGLGYVLIQLSPLFLEILRQVGKAIQ